MLLLIFRTKHYLLIHDLVSPGKPKDNSLDELTALLINRISLRMSNPIDKLSGLNSRMGPMVTAVLVARRL